MNADHQHQDTGVPTLCAQYSALWQQVMDSLFLPRMKAGHFSRAQPQANSECHVQRSCTKQECPKPGRNPEHACTPDPVPPAMAKAYQMNGR